MSWLPRLRARVSEWRSLRPAARGNPRNAVRVSVDSFHRSPDSLRLRAPMAASAGDVLFTLAGSNSDSDAALRAQRPTRLRDGDAGVDRPLHRAQSLLARRA